ncbi:hypothetical protein [Parasphingorhabdus sp.]|uniref:hypothetical protein n=1 Tax=Parasphingorhabdus sp. TaxID=2709688 RepID=UPI002B275CE1|nr:hypothetical protein [Parasphingorhabdus sp.]
MTIFSRHMKPSALERMMQRLRPRAFAERFAEGFERSPVAFGFVAVLAPAIAYVSALGVRGAMGAPFPIALIIGVLGVYAQCAFFAMLRAGDGPKFRIATFLFVVSAWNAASLSAGVVAANPDAMGRALIGRQLDATIADAASKAATLETLASSFDGLSAYSTRQSEREGAPSKAAGYAATCQNSTGPGVGPISTWRKSTGDDATTRAASLRSAATTARRAASDSNRAALSYSLSTHDQSMRQIGDAVAAIGAASAATDRLGMAAMLNSLDAATRDGGVCPDSDLQGLISSVRAVRLDPLNHGSVFTAPPRPSEAEAVADLWAQVIKWWKGDEADFSLYAFPLLLSPFIDLVLMTMLGMALPCRRADDDEAIIAARMGIDLDEAPLLDDAIAAVAADPIWTDLVGNVEDAGKRWLRVKRIRIHKEDWANLHRMRHLAELGKVHDGGMVEDHQVYVLRPRFLFERFDQLIRKRIIASRVSRVAPSSMQTENAQ